MQLAKRLASRIVKGEKIDEIDTSDVLNPEEKSYVVEKLTNPDEWLKRNSLNKKVNADKTNEWRKLKKHTEPQGKLRYLSIIGRVAAIFVGVIGIAYFYFNGNPFGEQPQLDIKKESIVLELEKGAFEELSETEQKQVLDSKGRVVGVQEANVLNYFTPEESTDETEKREEALVYHELTVPYGKTFQVVLSDGTRVHLNAGSSLRYPIKFLKGKKRKVFLQGEAFFNVAKDEDHPFIANAEALNIRVLGTQFVITSYPEDPRINTVLVEGSVGIFKNGKEFSEEHHTKLEPGFKAAWNKTDDDISIERVNVDIYTAWIDGRIVLSKMPFNDILKKLERKYDVSIENNNKLLGEEIFTASFDVETIEQVLTSFSKNYPFEFSVENNRIIIH